MTQEEFPTPWTIEVLPYVAGPADSHGNVSEGWADPITYAVYGWAPLEASSEPAESGRDAVVTTLQVLAPADVQVTPRDRVIVDGITYEVIGQPADYTHGPFDWRPGTRIALSRVEG